MARSASVWKPLFTRRSSATGPTPQMRRTGSGARKLRTPSPATSSRPSGLAASLAILATILTGAMPTETGRPVSSRTARRKLRPTSTGGPWRRCVPVRSRKASSSDRPSTTGVKRRKISKMRFDSRA